MTSDQPRILVIGDSLTFHVRDAELITHPDLWPNLLARALGAHVDVVARIGWTARDAWWALTRDPNVWSLLVPRADVVILAVGNMDTLPTWLPTYVREGIAVLRPGWLRRGVRNGFRAVNPTLTRLVDGRVRMLPQAATDHYLSRCVRGIRTYRPDLPIVGVAPPPYDPRGFGGVFRTHAPAVEAARAWAEREQVALVDLDAVVTPYAEKGLLNPDGMHWSWEIHEAVAAEMLQAVRDLLPLS